MSNDLLKEALLKNGINSDESYSLAVGTGANAFCASTELPSLLDDKAQVSISKESKESLTSILNAIPGKAQGKF